MPHAHTGTHTHLQAHPHARAPRASAHHPEQAEAHLVLPGQQHELPHHQGQHPAKQAVAAHRQRLDEAEARPQHV